MKAWREWEEECLPWETAKSTAGSTASSSAVLPPHAILDTVEDDIPSDEIVSQDRARDAGSIAGQNDNLLPPWLPNSHARQAMPLPAPEDAEANLSDTDLDQLAPFDRHTAATACMCDVCGSLFTGPQCRCASLEAAHPITKIMNRVAASRDAHGARRDADSGAGALGPTVAMGRGVPCIQGHELAGDGTRGGAHGAAFAWMQGEMRRCATTPDTVPGADAAFHV